MAIMKRYASLSLLIALAGAIWAESKTESREGLLTPLAPAECLTPLGNRLVPVPYQSAITVKLDNDQQVGSAQVPMDGCAPHGLKALSAARRLDQKRKS